MLAVECVYIEFDADYESAKLCEDKSTSREV